MWVFLFVMVGVVVRTLLPYMKKKAEGGAEYFDPKFAYTAILGVVLAYIELAAILAEDPYALANIPLRLAILMGFFFGMGNSELCNRILYQAAPKK